MNAPSLRDLVMLVVEDNPADVLFFEEAVEASQTPAKLHVVCDGSDAMRFLRRQSPHAGAPRPDVMVLDLNLPVKSGKEVLAEMAADPDLRTIPVAILTTSTSERWVCGVYPSGRCTYFVKTDEFKKLQEIVKSIAHHAVRPWPDRGEDGAQEP
jgi:two-component system response regulator